MASVAAAVVPASSSPLRSVFAPRRVPRPPARPAAVVASPPVAFGPAELRVHGAGRSRSSLGWTLSSIVRTTVAPSRVPSRSASAIGVARGVVLGFVGVPFPALKRLHLASSVAFTLAVHLATVRSFLVALDGLDLLALFEGGLIGLRPSVGFLTSSAPEPRRLESGGQFLLREPLRLNPARAATIPSDSSWLGLVAGNIRSDPAFAV